MKVYAIAVNTFKEVIRDKIFYSLVFFALLILGMSVIMSALTVGERAKIIEDLSLAGISIFGIIISIFVGIGLVSKELEKKTIYTIISKPIQRYEFLLGKYLGLALVLLAYISVMTLVFLVVLLLSTGVLGVGLLPAVLLIYVELLVVTAAALLFSTFSTPTLSATYTLALYIIGHLTSDLKGLAAKAGAESAKAVLEFLYYALPNLENFNIKGKVVHDVPVGAAYMFMAAGYGAFYVCALLLLAALIFQKRNFK
ncbi:MAG: ABC transporter permease [Nitrospirae bacterium]|nr:ABC transporter permease [Nitrospirota bacterium]MBI5694449.1 ABC transporter permease [Nitrospirota bacterium]